MPTTYKIWNTGRQLESVQISVGVASGNMWHPVDMLKEFLAGAKFSHASMGVVSLILFSVAIALHFPAQIATRYELDEDSSIASSPIDSANSPRGGTSDYSSTQIFNDLESKSVTADKNRWGDLLPIAPGAVVDSANFSGMDLRGAQAGGAEFFRGNFQRANMAGANFSEAFLSEANLDGAFMQYASFRSAQLQGARMLDADLSQANLRGAILINANLKGAVLTRANLVWADLTIANFEFSNLYAADLGNSLLIGVNFRGSILAEANLSGARLHDADFAGADLYRANFEDADLRYARITRRQLSMACGNSGTRLPDSHEGFVMPPCH